VSKGALMGITPSREMAVCEGRIPKAPLLAAGSRTEPPLQDGVSAKKTSCHCRTYVSDPMVTSTQSYAPILEPLPADEVEGSW
jgi:hypothetical protein